MKTYRLNPDGFADVKRRLWLVSGVIFPTMVVGVLFASGSGLSNPATYASLLVFAVIDTIFHRKNVVQQRRYWDTFVLTLDDREIVRRIEGYADFHLDRAAITRVETTPGGLVILAGPRRLGISKHLLEIEDLQARLLPLHHA